MDGSTRNGAGINYSCEARRCLADDLILSKAVGFILINIDRIVRFVRVKQAFKRFHNCVDWSELHSTNKIACFISQTIVFKL